MSLVMDSLEPNNLRLVLDGGNVVASILHEAKDSGAFLRAMGRSLLSPRARSERATTPGPVFPPFTRWEAPALRGKRVALLASGGSGALSSLCGMRRALDEADVSVSRISACSGAMLFASLWALGLSGDEMADFWLSMRTRDYVDPDFRGIAHAARTRMRGWTGIVAGDAVERTFRDRFGDVTLGDLRIPISFPAWNVDDNRVTVMGTEETPHVPLARAVHVAIAIPVFVQPVEIDGRFFGDGGIIDVFPAEPLVHDPADVVIGVNCYFPENFDADDVSGWHDASWSIFRASKQLRSSAQLEVARRGVRALGDRLVLLHPVPYTEIRGAKFYETFFSREKWPRFIVDGHACIRDAFAQARERSSAQAVIGSRGDAETTRPARKNTSDASARPL